MIKLDYFKKVSRLRQTASTSFRLVGLLWQIDKWLFLTHAITVIIPAVVPFAFAYIFKLLIDQVVKIVSGTPIDWNYLTGLFISGFVVYTIQSMAFSAQDYIGRLIYTKVPISLYQKVLNKVSSLDLQYFEDSEFKSTLEKVRDSYTWRPINMMDSLFFTLQSLVQILASIIILAKLAPGLIFIILIIAIPQLISNIKESELSWGIWDTHSPFRKKFWYVSSLLQERDSVKEMKVFQLPSWFLTELKGLHEDFYEQNKKLATKYFAVNSLFNILGGVIFFGVLFFIILEAIARRITVGDVSFYTTSVTNFQNGVGGLFRNIVKLFSESLYVSSLFEVFDAKSLIISPQRSIKLNFKKPPVLEFRNVTFKYPHSSKKILENFSLILKPGEKIALVGENGAGKTTIIKLLCRFYDVTSGEILVNGQNIKDLDLESWYKAIGILFQDFIKYEYPVSKNIFFGKVYEKERIKKIIEAAMSSGADPMVKKLKAGYDQMLGRTFAGGVELSVGQWQKIALARAFYRDAPVLVLDEPTASIDAKAEAEIFDKVEKLSKGKTLIIISHRFSTVRNADKIYVIENGKISESGSHKDLMKLNGQYATLFNLQAKGYK